jgi:putative restriction endonuclease
MGTPEDWLGRFAKLKVDRAKGDPAPHKPLLLLVVLELAEQGELPNEFLPLTPELAFRFCTYWSIVARRRKQRPDVRFPFYHLKSDGVWTPLTEAGKPAENRGEARSAHLPADFVAFARDPAFREQARRILIAKYFPAEERANLYTLVGLPVPSEEQVAQDARYQPHADGQKRGREARFRLLVVGAYYYTCALTRYRLTTISGSSIVDAAHIHQFADSRNNDPQNGLALCKNAHWLFDNGLWTLTDYYQVMVATGEFEEAGNEHDLLRLHKGRTILLPGDHSMWPGPRYLEWHRRNKFKGVGGGEVRGRE